MSANSFEELTAHQGHDLVISTYGRNQENATLECLHCFVVLMSFDKEEETPAGMHYDEYGDLMHDREEEEEK